MEDEREQLRLCRVALREVIARAVRHKFNPNWHEVTLTAAWMEHALELATERPATTEETGVDADE